MITTIDKNAAKSGVLDTSEPEHICATCSLKERVTITNPDGKQMAMVWRCRELTMRFHQEILVEPTGSCYESKSMSDYWKASDRSDLVW